MAGPETHEGHHDIDSLNRFEQDRGKISWEQVQEVIDSLPADAIKKIRHLLTGKENGTVDDEKEGYKLFSYYLATLYQLDIEDAFARVEAMEEDARRKLVKKVTGSADPDAVIDDEDPQQLRKLLTHFRLNKEGRFAKVFLAVYDEKFALKKPTDALLTGIPTEREIEDQIEQCVNTGGPAITRLRIGSIAKLRKIAEEFKIPKKDFPEVLEQIEEILERLQAEEKKTDAPERARDEAKRELEEKTAALDDPKTEERLAKEDLERERDRLLQKPKETLARAEKKLADAHGDEKDARWRFERAHELYLKAQQVAARQKSTSPVDSKDLDDARGKLKEAEEKHRDAKDEVRKAQAAVDRVEDEDLAALKQKHEDAKRVRIAAERALEPFKKALRDRERELAQAKDARKPVARELKDIPKGEINAQLREFFAILDKKRKSAQEGFPVNQPGENIVYLCIKREREALGEKDEYLEKRTAHDTAILAVGVTSVAFEGIESAGKGLAERARYQRDKGVAAATKLGDWIRTWRNRTDKLFQNIPLLNGLQTSSPEHTIKHHFEKESLPVLVELLGYLRHEATVQRNEAILGGIPFHQLTDLERFVKVLEEIVASRLGDEIGKAGDKGWGKAHAVLDENLHKPLAHVADKFDEVKKDLQRHQPAGGAKEGGGHEGGKGKGEKALGVIGSIGGALAGVGHLGDILRGRRPSGGGEKGGGKPSRGGSGGTEGGH